MFCLDLDWDGVGAWPQRLPSPLRVSVPLLKTLDQMLANGCFDLFTAEQK